MNRQKPLWLVVGKSGSGKDYIVNKIGKQFNMGQVISRTTRDKRFYNENTHLFISSQQADKEFGQALAKTTFCGNRYYVLKEDLEGKEYYIIDPKGVRTFKQNQINRPVIKLFINSPWYIRLIHMLKRGDKIKDIIKRLLNDRKEFKGFKNEADIIFKNNNEMYDYFEDKHLYECLMNKGRFVEKGEEE
ncbi:hypothetical protein [Clostridium sp. VAP52]|uniref:hypothetical protein n=1 Tax=Clostridium sp. VAP52 TaxID=2949977 RepID=UPI00207AED3D|nr:hypothetical protein [Clostridium sp. VAP52]